MKLNDLGEFILTLFITLIVVYLGVAFIAWDTKWLFNSSVIGRAFYLIFSSFLAFYIVLENE